MKSKKILKRTVSLAIAALLTLSAAAMPAMATAAGEAYPVTQAEYGKLVLVNSVGARDTAVSSISSSDDGATLTVTPEATVTEAGDASTAMKLDFVESEARSYIRFKTSTLSELIIDDTYLEFDLYLPTAETPADMRINLWLDISGWPSLKSINNIATKGYVKAQAGWQSVRIPMNEFTDGDRTTNSFDSLDSLILSFSFLEATTSTFYMKNIEFKTELSEVYDYDFEGEGIVRLIQDGKVVDGVTMGNLTAAITEDSSIDGVDAVYVGLPKANISGLSFSSDSIKAITNLKDYQLLWKVKFTAPDFFNYALYTTDSEGTETRYANIGQYIKSSDDWQTVVAPLSLTVPGTGEEGAATEAVTADEAVTDLSNVSTLVLRRGFVQNAWHIDYTAVQKHYLYISDLALVPKSATQVNNYTNEKILKDYQVLYRNAVYALPYTKTFTTKSPSKALYGKANNTANWNIIRTDGVKKGDLQFDISSLNLSDGNYSNKFLKFEICTNGGISGASDTSGTSDRRKVNVYRSATTSVAETYEGTTAYIPYGDGGTFRKVTTMLIPFEKFSQDTEALSWDDVNYLTIRLNPDGIGYSNYCVDNISIVELVGGEYTSAPEMVVSNQEAYGKYTVSNSMNSAYRFTPNEAVVVGSYDNSDDRMTGSKILNFGAQLVNPGVENAAIQSTNKLALPQTGEQGGTVKMFRWNSLAGMTPLADEISQIYITESEDEGKD